MIRMLFLIMCLYETALLAKYSLFCNGSVHADNMHKRKAPFNAIPKVSFDHYSCSVSFLYFQSGRNGLFPCSLLLHFLFYLL